MVSAPLSFGCLILTLAATGFDLDALADPVVAMRHVNGARGAELVRASMILDTFGYYLFIVPAVVHLDRELRRSDAGLATLLTVCGLAYVFIGAMGASMLAAVCPPLIVDLQRATGAERDATGVVLRAILTAVHGGLWNFLEMIPGAVFWIGTGAVLRSVRPRFAALTMTLGASAALDAIGEMVGLATLASIGLTIYLVLAPLWALCLGVLTARELGRRPAHEARAVEG